MFLRLCICVDYSVVPSATKPPVIGSYSPILYATVKMPISEMLDV